jgi:5-methylcytosine-specific restriction protein A
MGLRTVKPRLSVIATARVPAVQTQPGRIDRKRGSAGVKDRNEIKTRDCGLCQACKRNGTTTVGSVVDHITPLWAGGSDERSNKELLCHPCHDAKTASEAVQRARGW